MYLRQATLDELPLVLALFARAKLHLEELHIYQWDEYYPTEEILTEDIRKGEMYLGIQDGQIASVAVLNQFCDWDAIKSFCSFASNSFLVLHRLCVEPKLQGQHLGRTTMELVEDFARKEGFASLRLDTFTENPIALQLYKSRGYRIAGTSSYRKGLFHIMEKLL